MRNGIELPLSGSSRLIDRQAYEPAYIQLVDILQEQIAAGLCRPGDQLPSEAQLCAQYQVSPMTVRRAINILVERGLVATAQGRGTFVQAPDLGEAVFRLRELKHHLTRGEQVRVRLLEARMITADERVARKLAVEPGERTIYVRRLLLENGAPTIYHREYLIYDPTRPIVEGELEATSLEGLFQGRGDTALKSGYLSVQAAILQEEEARLLETEAGAAAFCLEHTFHDFDDRPVSWGWFICRGDRFKFTAVVGAGAAR